MVEKRFNRLELRELLENRIGAIVEPSSLEELENSFGGFDGFMSVLKTGRFEQKITRRDFAKLSCSMLAILTGIPATLQSCATIGLIKEEGPVHYPKLLGQKIQSPEHYGLEGCFTGIYLGDSLIFNLKGTIDSYIKKAGKKPTFVFLPHSPILMYYSGTTIDSIIYGRNKSYKMMATLGEMGIIPFISYDMRIGKSNKSGHKNVLKGKYDEEIMVTAQHIKKYGDKMQSEGKTPGIFIRTMREMNLPRNPWPWGGSAKKFKETWKHIWNIFKQEGANKYATWVFNPYVGHGWGIAERYNPGEKYYDWFGINGYNPVAHAGASSESFYQLFASAYSAIRRKYPDKPIMVAETGGPEVFNKAKWVERAFDNVKNDFPGIKGLAWWSEKWKSGGTWMDTRIDSSPEALEAFKKGISDPYFR